MCSIIGYVSDAPVSPVLVNALEIMEYRGYDSVGIATNNSKNITVKKDVGRVSEVSNKLKLKSLEGNVGIGHTRWATHGGVTKNNAHPHLCGNKSIAVVHNGIIENFIDLKDELQKKGIKFKSQTDTEVIPNLLSIHFEQTKDVKKSMINTLKQIKGHYAFIALFKDGTVAAARNHEPLLIGLEKDKKGYFVSSDVLGFLQHTRDVIYLENEQFVIIKNNDLKIYDFHGRNVSQIMSKIPSKITTADKGKYPHFMLKEIAEQSSTVLATSVNSEDVVKEAIESIKNTNVLYITGSGTSYNAALMAQRLFPYFTQIKTEPLMASDVRFSHDRILSNSVLIAISQSGESADVLESVDYAKRKKSKIISIVNSTTSSLSRESDHVIPLNCGTEIAVAATKSFTSQLVILYKIIDELSEHKPALDFKKVTQSIDKIFAARAKIHTLAKKIKNETSIYILGRGIHYPIAKEGALKIKEIPYIHAEGIATGELKHGPLALMDSDVYVIIINPTDMMYEDNLNSIHEIKARGAKVIGISDKEDDVYDYWIEIPKVDEFLYPLIEIVPFQLLAYFIAVEKNIDPDYPRNLAKSVTVK